MASTKEREKIREETRQRAERVLREVWTYRPKAGSFGDDLLILEFSMTDSRVFGEWTGDEVHAALQDLQRYFPRGAVFHSNRWANLDASFWRYAQESGEESFESAWGNLVRSALWVAVASIPDDMDAIEHYRYVRREVRKEIERALLDGQTLDEYLGRNVAPWPEPDTPEALALEAKVAEELIGWVELRLDVLRALSHLSRAERDVLHLSVDGYEDSEISHLLGVTQDAVRKRRQRAREKLKISMA